MSERDYKYIDVDRVNKRIEEGDVSEDDGAPPEDVLFETILDLLQLAENEGMSEDEVDDVVTRINDYRAERQRKRFRLHLKD